ncbi:MAG: FAD-binding protein, partial [Coriobacteriales bacterium]|nr:FAD-binding protein [Coriobacteriales bacterium]
KGFALTTITQPPFYALELGYSFMATLGGVICDPDTMQVLDEEQNPISGLYAAGNAVGGRFGAYYGNNISGLSNGFADVQGYLAGETVAKN